MVTPTADWIADSTVLFHRFLAVESGTKRMSRSWTGWAGSCPSIIRFRSVDGNADRRLDRRFHRPVPQVLGRRVGHKEDVAVMDRLVGFLSVNHAFPICRW